MAIMTLRGCFDGFASVYVGPTPLFRRLAAFLLRGPADSDSGSGLAPDEKPAPPTLRPAALHFHSLFPLTWCAAVGTHFCPWQLSWHLESYCKNGEVDVRGGEIHPLAQLSNQRPPPAPESPAAAPFPGRLCLTPRPPKGWQKRA